MIVAAPLRMRKTALGYPNRQDVEMARIAARHGS